MNNDSYNVSDSQSVAVVLINWIFFAVSVILDAIQINTKFKEVNDVITYYHIFTSQYYL